MERHEYQNGHIQPNLMMPHMYPPFSYYPYGFPDPRGYPQHLQMYPQMYPYLHHLPFPPHQQFTPATFVQGPGPEGGGRGQMNESQPGEHNHLKETTETGDESDGKDEESDSEVSESKHRSFGRKRKMNPDSGSVGAKFQTVKYRG